MTMQISSHLINRYVVGFFRLRHIGPGCKDVTGAVATHLPSTLMI